MAIRVPTVNGPSVADDPLRPAFQRSSASPALLGNAQLQQAGRVMEEVGAQIQERADADELMRAETAIKGEYLKWEGEAKQRRGQQAWGVAKDAGDWWDQQSGKASEGLTSGRAKKLFAQEVARQKALSVGAFSAHEAGQRRASLDESAQASIVGSINMAAANPNDAALQATVKGDILRRNEMRAKLNGWSSEMADAKRMEYLTNYHKQVIQGLVRDTPEAAEAYFNANKAEIEGSQHAEVGAFAQKATATRIGEAAAAAAWQQIGPKGDRDPVQLDLLEQAIRDRTDIGDEAKKTAISALKERATAFKDARRERDEALEASVNMAVMDGAGAGQVRRMPEFMRMDGEKQRRIMDFIENRALRREQQAAARESRAASAEAREQSRLNRQGMAAYLAYSNPDTLIGMTEAQIANLLPTLGNEHTKHLMEQRRQLAANPQKLAEARMDEDDFKQVAQEMGLRPFAAKTEEEKAALGSLKYRVEQLISATQQGGKKALSRTEKLEMMRSELARTVTVDGWFSNSEVPVIALKPEQIKDVVVPADDRREIAAQMQQMARQYPNDSRFKPTEDNLRRWYLRGKSRAADTIPNAR